ncbi:MAG: hypothetical protein ABI793_13730 [Flavobacterium sp.]
METDTQYTQEIKFNFYQQYQGIILEPDTNLIDGAIDTLLKDANILRNENIPNEEQVINENDYITNHQEDDDYDLPEPSNQEEELNDEDLDEEDWERNDHSEP